MTTTAPTDDTAAELPCHRCGYDLRATPPDGTCPECAASVAESRRVAAIPRRPAWRDSDPRWRRRILAGAWILVLLPLMDALRAFDWAASIRVPTVLGSRDPLRTLDDSFIFWPGIYQSLIFVVGMALLFSNERGRQRNRWDWTRRWGVLCTYVVLLLAAAPVLYIGALVLTGISALFISMPVAYQPGVTDWFARVSGLYLHYGPQPKDVAGVVLVVASSITVLLACFPLFDALRSTGSKRFAAILLAPLALFTLVNFTLAARCWLDPSTVSPTDVFESAVYFRPEFVLTRLADGSADLATMPIAMVVPFVIEIIKWGVVLTIALWLTLARFAPRRPASKAAAGA